MTPGPGIKPAGDTLVGGERSHRCAIPAPAIAIGTLCLLLLNLFVPGLTYVSRIWDEMFS